MAMVHPAPVGFGRVSELRPYAPVIFTGMNGGDKVPNGTIAGLVPVGTAITGGVAVHHIGGSVCARAEDPDRNASAMTKIANIPSVDRECDFGLYKLKMGRTIRPRVTIIPLV